MTRQNQTAFPVHDLLKSRWSPRAFADKPVEPEKLRSIMEAARWAPSSSNEQPWRYIVSTKDDTTNYARIFDCLVEGNKLWAKSAPVLMISVGTKTFTRNGKPNRFSGHDVGQASAMLSIQATALGLYVHQMGGFDAEKARQEFNIPETAEAMTAIALGYLGDPATLPEDLRKRELTPSPRKPITDFVFTGQWGTPATWLNP